jgi:hypothetical protein
MSPPPNTRRSCADRQAEIATLVSRDSSFFYDGTCAGEMQAGGHAGRLPVRMALTLLLEAGGWKIIQGLASQVVAAP